LSAQGSRGVIWEHELPLEINYVQEQAFFHTFAGDVRCVGSKVFL
jgi:Wiskott-Aldrich syndrome protein